MRVCLCLAPPPRDRQARRLRSGRVRRARAQRPGSHAGRCLLPRSAEKGWTPGVAWRRCVKKCRTCAAVVRRMQICGAGVAEKNTPAPVVRFNYLLHRTFGHKNQHLYSRNDADVTFRHKTDSCVPETILTDRPTKNGWQVTHCNSERC